MYKSVSLCKNFIKAIGFSIFLLRGSTINISIVKAEKYHSIPDIVRVINSAYAKIPYIKAGIPRVKAYEVESLLINPHKTLYLCIDELRICGTAVLSTVNKNPQISLFAIDPTYQGKKIGELLLQHIHHCAQTRGITGYLYLNVIPLLQERLVRYYERNGFILTNETGLLSEATLDSHIKPEYRDTIYFQVMRKEI